MPDTDDPSQSPSPNAAGYVDIQSSPEFQDLRRSLRRFVIPTTIFFLVWYASYVLLGAFAHDFMAIRLWGNINVGLLVGLGQFVTTFVITGLYVRFANRELDPRADAVRARLEEAQGGRLAWPPIPSAIRQSTSAFSRHSSSRPCSSSSG